MDLFLKWIELYYPLTEKLEVNEELSYYIMKELDMIRTNSLYKIHSQIHAGVRIHSSFESILELNNALSEITDALTNSTAYRSTDKPKEIQLASFFINSQKKGFIDEVEELNKLNTSLKELFKLRDQADEYCVNNSVLTNDVSANLAVTLRSLNNVLWELYELLVALRSIVERE